MTKHDMECYLIEEKCRGMRLKRMLTDIKGDLKATNRKIRFWENELKKAKD